MRITNSTVHHDPCRPEVAVAEHRRSLGRLPCRWVTARRLPGRHSSVAASPLRCQTGLLVGAEGLGKTVTSCPQVVFLPAGTGLDTGELK